MSSAAVVIGALRVNKIGLHVYESEIQGKIRLMAK